MKHKTLTGKRLFRQMMVMLFMCMLSSTGASTQIVLHDATDVTQTKATLSADFPDLSAEHGFQYKYGILPELDDFSRLALAELSDPVLLTTSEYAWSARTAKGWVESKSGLYAGQSSVMGATVTFSEQTEVSFEWSVDSEEGIGILSFVVDGSTVKRISGEVGFTTVTYTASAGKHTFQWQYMKSAATNVGLDIGMVRNINFQNTTEGEWLQASTSESRIRLQDLYPNESYLFRPYYYSNKNVVYGAISTFHTWGISIEQTLIEEKTQTKTSLINLITEGDTPLKAYYLVESVYSDTDQKALLHKDSDPVATLSKTSEWQVIDGIMSCVSLLSSADLTVTFSLTDTATVSFDWAVKGINQIYSARTSRMLCLVDNRQQVSLSSTSNDQFTTDSFSIRLPAGFHTIAWKPSVGYGDSFAKVYNLKINNTDYDFSEQAKKYPAEVVSNHAISCKLEDLNTNDRYMAKLVIEPNYESLLPKRWNSTPVWKVFFRTLNVLADTLQCSSISQASATVRGKIDGGDATIHAAGLQYKDATGSRWTDFPKEVTDTLLTHSVTRLRPSTTYNYRSYIQAVKGKVGQGGNKPGQATVSLLCDTVFSEIGTFTTLAVEARKPVLVNRTQHTAELEGKVIFGDASIYQRGMQFRKAGSDEWEEVEDGGNDSIYTLKKTGLEMKTHYQARTYIQPAGSDIIYSDILDFRTKSVEVYIDSITNIYQRNVTVHGRIDCTNEPLNGGCISVYRVIGGQLSDLVKTVDIPTSDSLFVQKVTGLQPNTSYCFIAELDYGNGQKAYSNIHESEVTEIDAYKKSLLAPESSTDVEITYAENWEATDDELYFGHYAWYDDLTATFTLTKTTTISFDWSVVRSYAYTGSTSPDIKLFVDGSSTASKSIAATVNNKTFSDHVTLTLNAGKHTQKWRPNYTGNFYIKNLLIPADATVGSSSENTTITTRGFFKSERIIATDVTQTKAFLIASLEETDENVEGYVFNYYSYPDFVGHEPDKQEVSVSVEDGAFGHVSTQLSNLYPAKRYGFSIIVSVGGERFYSPWKSFETLTVTPHAIFNSITQTGVWMNDFYMEAGDAEIRNLQYYVPGSSMDGYHNINEHESLIASGLTPNTDCEVLLRWTVSDKEYSHSWKFKTKATTVTCSTDETYQTSAVIRINPNYGTATYINSGFIFTNDSVVDVPLGETARLTELNPNTSYTIRPFIETVQGGTVYSNNITFRTKAISMNTLLASNISNRSATMNGTINCDNYSSAEFGFQWKQMEGWNSDPAFTKGVKNEDGSISVALVNGMLEPNTDYQYRTAVRYKGQIYYADKWETFRTESEFVYYPASVYTVFRTDRENNCLILCGYYVAGSETVTAQGYEYWRNQSNARSYSPASISANNVVTITTDESMQYSLDLKTLTDGNYSVRAFVTTSSGITTYGETLNFGVQNQADAVEGIECNAVRLSSSGTTLTIHNGMSLVCTIYSLNGTCVAQRKLTGAEERFDLQHHDIYIIRLSNGKSYKIKL
jgi:hypothetical protein